MIDHLFNLLETAAVVFGGITAASLVFANLIHKRMVRAEKEADEQDRLRSPEAVAAQKAAIAEKRRVLIERRDFIIAEMQKEDGIVGLSAKNLAVEAKITKYLLDLADEEAKLHAFHGTGLDNGMIG